MFRYYDNASAASGTLRNRPSDTAKAAGQEAIESDSRSAKFSTLRTAGIFLFGPLSGLLFVCLLPLISLLIVVTLFSKAAFASGALQSEEAAVCMSCHSTQDAVKTFRNREKLSVRIAESHFRDSVHSFLTCTSCHSAVSMESHPSAQYASRQEFVEQISKACRGCHSDEQLRVKPIHWQAITRSNAPPCSECHGSHSVRKTAAWKQSASNSQYCLTCHKKDITTSVNGEALSLAIDENILKKSVHRMNECTQCHSDFSKKDHPLIRSKNRRELSIALSGVCRGCHDEKYRQHEGSFHSKLLMEGNRDAPVCTDCHGAHSIGPKDMAETLSGTPCRKCHENTFEAYKSSVHGRAKMSGNTSAPICSSCHSAHEVRPALSSRSPRTTCLGCHKDAAMKHQEWLPNSERHLETIACTACHVANAETTVYLRVTDNASGQDVYKARLKETLGAGYDSLTSSRAEGLEAQHLWDVYQRLGGNRSEAGITGTIGLEDCSQSHKMVGKKWAVKQCDGCHDADSRFFKSVAMAIISSDGKEEHYKVNRAALGSVYTLLPMNRFYVLGSTRVKLLDIIGVLMVFGGMSVPIVHLTLRILTIPVREAKRMNKLRKEGRK